MIHYLREKRWLFIALLVGGVLLHLPPPEGLSGPGWVVLCKTVVATILFITEPVPLPTVALLIVGGQVLLLGIDSSTVARSLMKDSVLFIMGSLMLAVALVKQNLDKRLALLIVRVTGSRTVNIGLGVSVVSGLLASLIGEHTVAAMMLPVALTLVHLSEDEENPGGRRNTAVFLLFSISYACSMAGIGTPSGGARNAIMIDYLRSFFFKPTDPETGKYLVGYARWMLYAYPLFLVQLPLAHLVLRRAFRPEVEDLGPAVEKLREQVGREGRLSGRHGAAIVLFVGTLLGWVFFSEGLGMGTVAILGAAAFLCAGLVSWNDVNSGVNWGVVLLYAAAISLGVQMKDTGAAAWVAESVVGGLSVVGLGHGFGVFLTIMLLTTLVTNTMSNGAAVAVLGPVVLNMAQQAGASPLVAGFVCAVSSAFAYLTVIGTPASAIVHASGLLRSGDFVRAGWRLTLMSFVLLMLFAALYWPLLE